MNITLPFLGVPARWKDAQIHLSALQGLWGGWQVFVGGNGEAVVRRVSPLTREQRYKLLLNETELHSLFEACIENDLLAVPRPQRPGIPDEVMVQLTLVNAEGEYRTVSKWARDVLPEFEAVSRPLFALTTRTKDMIPFYTGPFEWPTSPGNSSDPLQGS
jgi:hypothetical protein